MLVYILVFLLCDDGQSLSAQQRPNTVSRRLLAVPIVCWPPIASARNLPEDLGARGDMRGDAKSLAPIVAMRRKVQAAYDALPSLERASSILREIPSEEREFKRLFDEFSEAVSYKQKFLDSNAFLVYYTDGFDGVGRPKIEEDVGKRETLQFGARNDAWVAVDDARAEVDYSECDLEELGIMLRTAIAAFDAYLALAPPSVVQQASLFTE